MKFIESTKLKGSEGDTLKGTCDMPKQHITKTVKTVVWLRDCHPADNRFAQCKSCTHIVRFPQAIQTLFHNDNLPKKHVKGVAEFGHIIAEAKGGKNTPDNLIIQCKSCNTKTGTHLPFIDNDVNMIDTTDIDTMEIESAFCLFQNCKNKTLKGYPTCHVHLNIS